jgi:predicted hotdog family 3-hydroxylacyl-ACP dehydratase
MADEFPPLDLLIPHQGGMRLISRVIEEADDLIVAEAVIAADSLFYVPGRGVPAYVGFEMMAQTISAHDGLRRWRSAKQPTIGFLLGCRRYVVDREWFVEGDRLRISAETVLGEGEMRSFQCRIVAPDGAEAATGLLNVFQPANPAAFIAQQEAPSS